MSNSPNKRLAHSKLLAVLAVVSLFICAPVLANDSAEVELYERKGLSERCYLILHAEQEVGSVVDEEERAACLREYRISSVPSLVVTPLRREQDISRAPASVGLLTRRQLERSTGNSLAEVLRDVPGVEVTDAGQAGLKRIRIRGEESRRVAILFDGQEFSDEREVGTPILIAPEMIERIEVLRGTGSVLHGSRAVGGVINFITKKGGYHPLQATASALYDSATDGYQIFSSFFGADGAWEYRVAGSLAEHGDRESPRGEVEDTSFDNNSVLLYLGREFDRHSVSLRYEDYNSDSEVYVEPEVATTPPFRDFQIDAPQRDRSKIALFYDWESGDSLLERVHMDAYYQESEREFNTFSDLQLDFGAGPFIRNSDVFNSSTLDTLGTNLQADFQLTPRHHLITGLEAKNDNLDQSRRRELQEGNGQQTTEVVTDEARQWSVEVFAQDKWLLLEDWSLILGARSYFIESELERTSRPGLELVANSDEQVIGSLGFQYTGVEDVTFWGTWSQGYVAPTLITTATGAFAGPDFVSPNPDLEPETSHSIDLGVRIDGQQFMLDTSLFFTRTRDYIEDIPCASSDVACIEPAVGRRDRVFVNIDKVQSFGGELSASYNPRDFLQPYVSVAWVRRRFERQDFMTYETGIPTVSGRLGLLIEKETASNINTWADFYLRAATNSREMLEDGEIEQQAGWGTLNASLGCALGDTEQLKFVVELFNLSDKLYVTANENLPARGRSLAVKVIGNI